MAVGIISNSPVRQRYRISQGMIDLTLAASPGDGGGSLICQSILSGRRWAEPGLQRAAATADRRR